MQVKQCLVLSVEVMFRVYFQVIRYAAALYAVMDVHSRKIVP